MRRGFKHIFMTAMIFLLLSGIVYAGDLSVLIGAGELSAIKSILQKHPELLNQKDANKLTPLNLASFKGQTEIVQYLLDEGADMSIGDQENSKPLHNAAAGGHLDTARILVKAGADINEKDDNNMTPLLFACSWGHDDLVTFLLDAGADMYAVSKNGMSSLFHAAITGRTSIDAHLLDEGYPVNKRGEDGQNALHMAVRTGKLDIIDLLLKRGADLQAKDNNEQDPLSIAIYGPNAVEVVAHLLDLKANVNTVSAFNQSLLYRSILRGNCELTNLFLEHGVKLDITETEGGKQALHVAAIKGYADVVRNLLAKKADPNIKDYNEHTPLYYAMKYGHKDVVDILMAGGAKAVNLAQNYGTPPDLTRNMTQGEAAVWFTGHSGWAIKTQNHLLVFDYYESEPPPSHAGLVNGYLTPEVLKGQNVVVFVSHAHRDHFFPSILEWRDKVPNITYIFGFQPEDVTGYNYIGPREKKNIEQMSVTTLESNDTGVGFLVEVDGLTLFHAGDHANRTRDFSGPYTKEIEWIAQQKKNIDIAFLPVSGCGFGDQVAVRMGVFYAIEKLAPAVIVPMHFGHWCTTRWKEVADEAKEKRILHKFFIAENCGDSFHYGNGKIL